MPRSEATHGTSTQQSAGRLSISGAPSSVFGTLPLKVNGAPVSQALMMSAPYSALRSTPIGEASARRRALRSSHSAIWRSLRCRYSSSGMLNCSIRSGRSPLTNHGTYSAKCSEDSVTK